MKKKILIILSVFIISLTVVSGAYFLFRHASENSENNDLSDTENFSPEPVLSLSELSLEQEMFDKAVINIDASLCGKMKVDISREICYAQVALGGGEEEACSLISDDIMKINCLDRLKIQSALDNQNLKSCLNIESEGLAIFCVKELAPEKNAADCLDLSSQELSNECLTVVNYKAAKESGNSELCRQIPNRLVMSNCLSEILDIDNMSDADEDGLKFFEEILNGTDPDNSDTDGDGYSDSEEVLAGYNAAGEGLAGYYYLNCYEIQEAPLREACLLESENGRINYQNCLEVQNEYLREYCLKKLEK